MSRRRKPRKGEGDCASVHADLLINDSIRPGSLETELEAVHGSVRLIHGLVSTDGVPPHFHCWIEFAKHFPHDGFPGGGLLLPMAHDRANGNNLALPADLYRHLGRAEQVREYTPKEALQQMVEHGHYGPWDPALRDHPEPEPSAER